MTPFILRGRRQLPAEAAPDARHVYDGDLQGWIETRKNLPLVECLRKHAAGPTQFGETTFTETREGADRTEGASIEASEFGETIQTRTREGVDQTESTGLHASQLGETTLTKTREGVDQSEGSRTAEIDASYSHF
jgi:hypothetical protein